MVEVGAMERLDSPTSPTAPMQRLLELSCVDDAAAFYPDGDRCEPEPEPLPFSPEELAASLRASSLALQAAAQLHERLRELEGPEHTETLVRAPGGLSVRAVGDGRGVLVVRHDQGDGSRSLARVQRRVYAAIFPGGAL